MAFEDVPRPATHLLLQMFALHEEIVCRRRMSGKMIWDWTVGIISPVLPAPDPRCAQSTGDK
jgi:para-nitrobenzyl esterase